MDTLDALAAKLGLQSDQLTKWSFLAGLKTSYFTYHVIKRSGGVREISAPAAPLRDLQRRLLAVLDGLYHPRACVHGFTHNRSIVSNAEQHVRRRHVLNVDLEQFFPSINFGRVRGALIAKPFLLSPSVATTIARLACHDNKLPQGAPTSPILANIVCMRLDGELARLANALGCRYTRYADDLTFSTNRISFPPELAIPISPPHGTHAEVGTPLSAVIAANGFSINKSKIRLLWRGHAQRVTGLTVNRFPNVQRTFVRQLRAMIHAWNKFGLGQAQAEHTAKYATRHRAPFRPEPNFARVLHGKLMYLGMVRGFSDPIYLSFAKQCRSLDPILFSAVLDKDDNLDRSVWILECEETHRQGTAFFLTGVGLITCHHVLGPQTVAFSASSPSDKFPVTVVASDSHIDLAILTVNANVPHSLKMGNPEKLHYHSRILVAGYPNYGYGDTLYKHWGSIVARRVRHGVKYFLTSAPIAQGNSGGPVIDERFGVVGVAVRGVKDLSDSIEAEPDAYGVISIEHLAKLAGQ